MVSFSELPVGSRSSNLHSEQSNLNRQINKLEKKIKGLSKKHVNQPILNKKQGKQNLRNRRISKLTQKLHTLKIKKADLLAVKSLGKYFNKIELEPRKPLSDITNIQNKHLPQAAAKRLNHHSKHNLELDKNIKFLSKNSLIHRFTKAISNLSHAKKCHNYMLEKKALQESLKIANEMKDKNIADEDGITPLHLACKHNIPQLVEYLIGNDADLNKKDNAQKSPLMYALRYDSIKCIKLLLQNPRVDINVRDHDGNTFLHYASDNLSEFSSVLRHIDFSKISLDTFMENDAKTVPMFVRFICNKELITPTLLQLSSMCENQKDQEKIVAEFTRSIEVIDSIALRDYLSRISLEEDGPTTKMVKVLKDIIQVKLDSIPEAFNGVEEQDRLTILKITKDIDAGNITELKNFVYSEPSPVLGEIKNIVASLEYSLKKQVKPLSDAWASINTILRFYELLFNKVPEEITFCQILQIAVYIVDNLIKDKKYIHKFSIIEKNEHLPIRLAIFKNGSISVLPYNMQEIARELMEESTCDSLKSALEKINDQGSIDCLKFELNEFINTNPQLPGAWRFLGDIYEYISKVYPEINDIQTLTIVIKFIEECNDSEQPVEMTSQALLLKLNIQINAAKFNKCSVNKVRKYLLSDISLSQIDNVISQFREILDNNSEPLSIAWQFLNDTIKRYDVISKVKTDISDHQKLIEAMPDPTQYALRHILKGINRDSLVEFLDTIKSNPPLTSEEIHSLMCELKRIVDQSEEINTSLQILETIIQSYAHTLEQGKAVNQEMLKQYFIDSRTKYICDYIYRDIDNIKLIDVVSKIRTIAQLKPIIGDSEVRKLITDLTRILDDNDSSPALLLKRIFQRYEQISSTNIERGRGVSSYEQLLLSTFIEYDIGVLGAKIDTIFNEKKLLLPRTIHVDNTGNLTIWARHAVSVVSGEGAFKKVLSALKIPFHDIHAQAERIVIAYQKRSEDQYSKDTMHREAAIFNKLQGIRGIIDLHSIIKFDDAGNINLGFMFPECEGNIKQIYANSKPTFEKQHSLAKQVISSVREMHARGIIHWDLKLENLLCKGNETLLSDFGMAFEPGVTEIRCPCYGSRLYSAPELVYHDQYGFHPENLDACKMAEVMSLGIMLYNLHFDTEFPYPTTIASENYQAMIEAQIETPLRELIAKVNREPEDDFKILIYKMVKSNPQERISLDHALEEINNPKYINFD